MLSINVKRTLATVISAAAVLASAGPASAATPSGLVVYNGHAGLGASVYQHNQTDLEFLNPMVAASATDGTSNTIMFSSRTALPGTGPAVIESIGAKYAMSRPLHVAAGKNEVAIETIEAPAAPHEARSVRAPRARA